MRLSFYTCDKGYADFLRTFDNKVPIINKADDSKSRPLVGVVLEINGHKFYAPLSSPKTKHLTMKNGKDFIKIEEGKYGVINLNNMIPISDRYIQEIDIASYPNKKIEDIQYSKLLTNQITWCNVNKIKIHAKALKLFESISYGYAYDGLKKRCCDFALLIDKSKDYND